MAMIKDWRGSLSGAWESVTDGWRRLRQSASSALTRFTPSHANALPAATDVDDAFYFPSASWAMLAGDVYEDEKKLVVRIEVPGMDKKSLDLRLLGDRQLVVSGEKQFKREGGSGRYRKFECAYGSFRRSVELPVPVVGKKAKATYRDGVLRVEFPKRSPAKPKRIDVRVQ